MNKFILIIALLFADALYMQAQELPKLNWVNNVGARMIPERRKIFLVNNYGAKNDGNTLATAAIQKAIDACSAGGGGIVSFRPGSYLSGSIFLKKNVHLF